LGIDDLGRNFDTLSKLRYMEDIMNGRQLRRKLKTISYGSTDISRGKFPFYAELIEYLE
jgi:hypothetical protein